MNAIVSIMARTRRQPSSPARSSSSSARNSIPPHEPETAHIEEPVPRQPQAPARPDVRAEIGEIRDAIRRELRGVIRELIREELGGEVRQQARAFPAAMPEPIPPPPPPPPPPPAVGREYIRDDAPRGRGAPFVDDPEFRRARKNFMELRPTSFYGTVSIVTAESWLGEVKRAFRSIQCPDRYRVELLYPLFRDEAIFWWDGVERSYPEGHVFTWDEFMREFTGRYYSEGERREKVKELLSLNQGRMTVRDYESRFHSLSRWAPEYVDTEEKKIELFTQGLNADIQGWVVIMRPKTYGDMIRCALDAEGAEEKKRAQHVGQSSRSSAIPRESPRSGRIGSSSHRPPPRSFSSRSHPMITESVARSTAQRRAGACFRCGQVGHYQRDCPVNQPNSTQRGLSSQSVQQPPATVASRPRPPMPPLPPPKRQTTSSGRVFVLGSTSELAPVPTPRDEDTV